jgi:hypothetical protein
MTGIYIALRQGYVYWYSLILDLCITLVTSIIQGVSGNNAPVKSLGPRGLCTLSPAHRIIGHTAHYYNTYI